MARETASDLIHTNAEYEKLKTKHGNDTYTPRETPGQQGPGRSGYDKQLFASWTTEELLKQARTLELDVDENTARDALVEMLEKRDATVQRTL